jgi:hypothetical protein
MPEIPPYQPPLFFWFLSQAWAALCIVAFLWMLWLKHTIKLANKHLEGDVDLDDRVMIRHRIGKLREDRDSMIFWIILGSTIFGVFWLLDYVCYRLTGGAFLS